MNITMKKFYVTYLTNEDDSTTVWVNAYNKSDAKERVRQEYWDVAEIIQVREA